MLGLNVQNFRRFAPNEIGFCNFGHFSLPENREEISIFSYRVGEEIRVFGQNIHPCSPMKMIAFLNGFIMTTLETIQNDF